MTQQKKGGRRTGRRRAFEVLYGLGFVPADSMEELRRAFELAPRRSEEEEAAEPCPSREEFAWKLVSGTWSGMDDIDATITRFSQHWKIQRIAKVELTILRLALFEMLHLDDVPLKVTINEAVELAKRFGDDNSKNFVNGILDAVAKAIENGELGVH